MLHLADDGVGPLVNTVTSGVPKGTITFTFTGDRNGPTLVTAALEADIPRGLAPVARRFVKRSFERALAEDKHDIESGNYPAPS